MTTHFAGPWLKHKRANHHIAELETLFGGYVAGNMQRMSPNQDPDARPAVTLIGEQLPEDVPTILGDAIHNLRVALDHAYYILVEKGGGAPDDWTSFPFGKNLVDLRASINGKAAEKLPAPAAVSYILDELQPYAGGQRSLYELHRLDIADKHTTILPVDRILRVDKISLPGGAGIEGISFVVPSDKKVGAIFAFAAPVQNQGDPGSAFDILFGPGALEGKSILTTLQEINADVAEALVKLETFI